MKSIYVFESNGQFKIGISKNVNKRLRSIKTGNPSVRAAYESEKITNAYKVESMIHSHFASYRTNGEWFSVPLTVDIIETVKGFVEKYGTREELPKTKEDKLARLLESLFVSNQVEIAALSDENKKIDMENERLKEQLRSFGWSDFDIQKIVEAAESSVLSQYA